MKNQKFCSIPFLYIELQFKHTHCSWQIMSFTITPSPWHMVVNLHSKRICSKGGELQATGGILDGKFLYPGKRAPHGSQLPTVDGSAFTLEQFNLVLFRKYRLNPLGQSQTAGSMTGSRNGVRVTHGTGSQFMVSASLGWTSPILLLGASRSTFGTSLAKKLLDWSPCLSDLPWRWQSSRRRSRNRDGIG